MRLPPCPASCLCLINGVMGYIEEEGRMEREIINYPGASRAIETGLQAG